MTDKGGCYWHYDVCNQRNTHMKSLVDQLAQYAAYHRDSRNIVSHLIGIPLIVVAVSTLLARPTFGVATLTLSPAAAVAAIVAIFYLRIDIRFGMLMTVLLALSTWAGQTLAAHSTALWLTSGLGLFLVGWIIQFIGHYYEGRKPAFVDDLTGLVIGPLFIVAELAFFMGLRNSVRHAVEQRAGPIRSRTGKLHV